MNRLILIGNGFDLAHGLKTSYHDFILDYLKDCFFKALDSGKIQHMSKIYRYWHEDILINISSIDYVDIPFLSNDDKNIIIKVESINEFIDIINKLKLYITYKGSSFVKALLNECIIKNWVDIESLYYEELKKYYKEFVAFKSGKTSDNKAIDRLRKLNTQLDFIKKELEYYLTKIEAKNSITIDFLKETIHHGLQPFKDENYKFVRDGNFLILNFNYTKTPSQYINKYQETIINIHGELNNEKNPIIFGYGDEVDKHYNDIEDLNENEFFKHIKSFDYFKTSNYSKLLRFIETEDFEVFVMGHSCGLSDRTMLNTIFARQHCKSIKIFYNPKDAANDYRNKTYEISRHFNNKASMREKIVPFPECEPMPQFVPNNID